MAGWISVPVGWERGRFMSFKYRIVICRSKIGLDSGMGNCGARNQKTRSSCKTTDRQDSYSHSFAFIAQLESLECDLFELNPLSIHPSIIFLLNSLYLCTNQYFTGLYIVIKDLNSGCSEINISNVKKTFSICDVFVNALIIAVFRKINLHFFIKYPTLKAQH